jgi:hypothetical protein
MAEIQNSNRHGHDSTHALHHSSRTGNLPRDPALKPPTTINMPHPLRRRPMRRPNVGALRHTRRSRVLPGRDVRLPNHSGIQFTRSLWNDMAGPPFDAMQFHNSTPHPFIPCKDHQPPTRIWGGKLGAVGAKLIRQSRLAFTRERVHRNCDGRFGL